MAVPTSADGDSGGLVGGSSEDEAKTPRDDESQVDTGALARMHMRRHKEGWRSLLIELFADFEVCLHRTGLR